MLNPFQSKGRLKCLIPIHGGFPWEVTTQGQCGVVDVFLGDDAINLFPGFGNILTG